MEQSLLDLEFERCWALLRMHRLLTSFERNLAVESDEEFDLYRLDGKKADDKESRRELLMSILMRILQFLAFLLLRILHQLQLFCRFAEFPNRCRPKCTTMPWSIWPSLMVLWGVCWMFYTPPPTSSSNDTSYDFRNDDSLPLFDLDLPFDFTQSMFPGDHLPLSGNTSWPNNLDSFDIEAPGHDTLEGFNLGPLGGLDFLTSISGEAETSGLNNNPIMDMSVQDPAHQLGNAHDSIDITPILFHESSLQAECNQDLLPSFTSEGNQVNGHTPLPPPSTLVISNTIPTQTPLLPQLPMSPAQTQNQPLDADGNSICKDYGCTNTQAFQRKCDWQKHMNQHTRPFRCSVINCDRVSAGFATKDELKRHVRTHDRQSEADTNSLFYCTEAGCPRTAEAGGKGFTRKDHLREHIRRTHPNSQLPPALVPRAAKISNASDLGYSSAASPQQMNQSIIPPSMRKRKHTLAKQGGDEHESDNGEGDMHVASQVGMKKVRSGDREADDISFVTSPEQRLIKENLRLQKQLERSDREVERLERDVEKCREMNKRLLESFVG